MIAGHSIAFNLPALLIVAAVTVILVYGIRESAQTNTAIVLIKLAVVVFVIAFGAFMTAVVVTDLIILTLKAQVASPHRSSLRA